MTVGAVFVDAERVAYDWVNGLEGDLCGQGRPLPKGAQLKRLRSPAHGAYVLLTALPGDDDYLAGGAYRARVSGAVYGATKGDAAQAAVAYANALRRLYAGNTAVSSRPGQPPHAVILVADAISGPFYVPDGDEERYVVDVDLYLAPLP